VPKSAPKLSKTYKYVPDTMTARTCARMGGPIPNVNLETGCHYGVISSHHPRLEPEAAEDIFTHGVNEAEESRREELRESLLHALAETTVEWLGQKPLGKVYLQLKAELIDAAGELTNTVEEAVSDLGLYDGMNDNACSYRWDTTVEVDAAHQNERLLVRLDESGDLWVMDSPYYTKCGECSPCAPNAGQLTSRRAQLKTYCLPPEWFTDNRPPYAVWRRDNDELVHAAISQI
jgi:hypothetical protein